MDIKELKTSFDEMLKQVKKETKGQPVLATLFNTLLSLFKILFELFAEQSKRFEEQNWLIEKLTGQYANKAFDSRKANDENINGRRSEKKKGVNSADKNHDKDIPKEEKANPQKAFKTEQQVKVIGYNGEELTKEDATDEVGLLGIDCVSNTPKAKFDTYSENRNVEIVETSKLEGGFGSAFFGNKKNYFEIPDEMKVFYGAHFLFTRNIQAGHKNYKISNIGVKHLESLSSHSSPFIAKMFIKDRKMCFKYNGVEHQHLRLLQRIFSITTYHNHYVLCFLDLKMKFKMRNAE